MTPEDIKKLERNMDNPGIEAPKLEPSKSTSAKAKPVSAFKTGKRYVAGKFKWFDTVFLYGDYTPPMEERYKEQTIAIHDQLGISMDAIARVTQPGLIATKEEVAAYESVTEEQWKEYFEKLETLYEKALGELLVDWTDPEVPFDKEFIPAMGYELKSAMVQHIIESSQLGKTQSFT